MNDEVNNDLADLMNNNFRLKENAKENKRREESSILSRRETGHFGGRTNEVEYINTSSSI
jgi:hypothetical protein